VFTISKQSMGGSAPRSTDGVVVNTGATFRNSEETIGCFP
jgi:hypothetical protein